MSLYYKFYHSFFGFSKIKIWGEKEKLLNALAKNEIDFWGTEITEDNALLLYGSVISSWKIIKEAENLGCEVEIVKRKGLPFIFEKYKKRYGIFAGILLAWGIIFFTSLFVWEVNVNAQTPEETKKILTGLEKCGLEMGVFLPDIDVRQIENEFLMNNPEYSFLAINIRGTVANVEFRHSVDNEKNPSNDGICNIVASKSGTIVMVEAYGGSPAVKVGDTVSEGDLLISAYMQGRLGVWRGVHAYGKITAAVYYDFQTEIPLSSAQVVYTGEEKTKSTIKLFALETDLFLNEDSPYEKCEIKSSKEQLSIWKIKLPIIVEKSTYYEQVAHPIRLNPDEAKVKSETEFNLWKEREIKGKIISEKVHGVFDEEKNAYVFSATVTVLEDIGKEQAIEQVGFFGS